MQPYSTQSKDLKKIKMVDFAKQQLQKTQKKLQNILFNNLLQPPYLNVFIPNFRSVILKIDVAE